ncbi:hypothetical protein A2U01_0049991, partial [Trifolium medium]|nr:hypothetical protein [Trifolium medium]
MWPVHSQTQLEGIYMAEIETGQSPVDFHGRQSLSGLVPSSLHIQ